MFGRGCSGVWMLMGACVVAVAATAARGADRPASKPSASPDPVIALDLPHPAVLVDRLTDPRIQQSLRLLPPYRKALESPQFRQLQAVVAMVSAQLGTTWDRALRDLAGGGLSVRVFAEPGRDPRIQAVMTARDPKLLGRVNEIFLNMARQDAKAKKEPDPVQTRDRAGTTLHRLGAGGKKALAYAIVDGRLAVASPAGDLEAIVDRLRADSGPRSEAVGDGALILRGHVVLERLRRIDPKRFTLPEKPDTGVILLFGSWYEAIRRARAVDATLRWSETQAAAGIELSMPKDARPSSFRGYLPGPGEGPMPPLRPPGTIASLSLWRDWATIWESRADLFKPEAVQGFAQLDTVAGQFFGAREFGPDVLGAFDPHWRLVVAQQDYAALKPAPDQKLPAFALVAPLNGDQEDFAARLKIAFQSLVAISNVDAAQKKAAVLELGSEEVDGIRIATTKYVVARKAASASEPGAQRYNYSPSAAQVGRYFVLSSSVGLARSLVRELRAAEAVGRAAKDEPATFTVEADGPEFARLLEQNRSRMVMQTMLGRGETKEDAEDRVSKTLALFRYLGHGRLVIADAADRARLDIKLDLGR